MESELFEDKDFASGKLGIHPCQSTPHQRTLLPQSTSLICDILASVPLYSLHHTATLFISGIWTHPVYPTIWATASIFRWCVHLHCFRELLWQRPKKYSVLFHPWMAYMSASGTEPWVPYILNNCILVFFFSLSPPTPPPPFCCCFVVVVFLMVCSFINYIAAANFYDKSPKGSCPSSTLSSLCANKRDWPLCALQSGFFGGTLMYTNKR